MVEPLAAAYLCGLRTVDAALHCHLCKRGRIGPLAQYAPRLGHIGPGWQNPESGKSGSGRKMTGLPEIRRILPDFTGF